MPDALSRALELRGRLRAGRAPAPELADYGPADRLRRALDPDFDAMRAYELRESLSAAQRRRLGLSASGRLERLAYVQYACFNCGSMVAGPEATCSACGYAHGGAAHRAVARG